MRSARSNGRRTLFGECRRAPSAIAAAPPVQGLRQVVRPRGRRVRPLHVQASPQGQALRDVRIPRVRRAGRARATGEVVEGTRIRRLEERDIDVAIALTDLEAWGYTREDGPAVPGGQVRGVRPIRTADLADLAHMDAKYFGASRRILLARLAEEFPATFLVAEHGGRLRGFIVGNPTGDSCEIGPWVVEPGSSGIAEDLYRALINSARTSEVAFSGPSQNQVLLEFVRKTPFKEVFRALRMWWGANEFPGDPAGIWAVGGLEKG